MAVVMTWMGRSVSQDSVGAWRGGPVVIDGPGHQSVSPGLQWPLAGRSVSRQPGQSAG